ncbi:MAG: BMP family protein [Anaerolineae bacterium]
MAKLMLPFHLKQAGCYCCSIRRAYEEAKPAATEEKAAATEEKVAATEAAAAPAAGSDEVFRIAVVTPSTKNDLAFSQSMYDALVKIQKEMGGPDKLEIAISESMFKVEDAAAAIRDYASQGYNLVIAHGSQYGTSLAEIAPDFPDTSFAWGTTVDTFKDKGVENVFAYTTNASEGGYVQGVMAAKLTKSKKIGVVGPIAVGDALLYVEGFKKGVKATDPSVEVLEVYTGSFSDVALASQAAQTHIDAGADILTGTGQMVVGAIGVAKEKKVLWFSTQATQASLAPEIVVSAQVYDWTDAIKQIISNVQKGTKGGEVYTLSLKNGGLKMEFNPGYKLADEVKAAADETIKGIVDGKIDATVATKK